MDEYLDQKFDEFENLMKFEEGLRYDVELSKRKLDDALTRAANIPEPSGLPKKSVDSRLQEIRKALEKRELSRAEAEKEDSFHVRLFETPTVFLFEMSPKYFIPGTEEAEDILRLNQVFEEKRTSADKVRCKDGFSQVFTNHTYNELLLTEPIEKVDKACEASNWILYDAYNAEETFKDQGTETEKSRNYLEEEKEGKEDKTLESSKSFQEALMITCRVLSSNNFGEQQIEFAKKHQPSKGISYTMQLLWTLSGESLGTVNKICSNPQNSKVFAVGYGDTEGPGALKVWHVKNPEGAERAVATSRAVTCLQFSRTRPRLLAATTRDGSVLLLDISGHEPVVSVVNQDELAPYPDPLWALTWAMYDDGTQTSERIFTIGQSGLLWLWNPNKKADNKQIAKLSFVAAPDRELNVRFQNLIDEPLDSDDESVDPDEYFLEVPYVGLSINVRESNKVYITTDMGCIIWFKLSFNDNVSLRQVDGSRANEWKTLSGHRFAVLGMQYSPYIGDLFLTHSSDGDVCIWMHGCKESLLQLRVSDMSLYDIDSATWSPSHSTILASSSRERVCIWDISRKTDRPMATLTGRQYTHVCFSEAGTNLLVGCTDGDVIVYRFSEMPHRPFLQKEHLEKALRKAVEYKPELLKELDTALGKK